MNKLLVAFAALLIIGVEIASSESQPSQSIKYTIAEDKHTRNVKRSLVVILEEKVTKEDLYQLARAIKDHDPIDYQRTFIGYYLKGDDKKDGFWARTDFKPHLEVEILGLSKEQEAKLTRAVTANPGEKVLGVWLDDRPYMGVKMTIYYSDDKRVYLKKTFSDGSSNIYEMIDFALEHGKRIEDKDGNDFGEYFIINEANQLEFWGRNGLFYTAQDIQQK